MAEVTREQFEAVVARLDARDSWDAETVESVTEQIAALERRLARLGEALGTAGESISSHCSSPSDAQHIAWECEQLAAALAEKDDGP